MEKLDDKHKEAVDKIYLIFKNKIYKVPPSKQPDMVVKSVRKCRTQLEKSLFALGVFISKLEHNYHLNRGELIEKY